MILRKLCLITVAYNYNQGIYFDLDWAENSIYMLLQEYELDTFANDHSKSWYNIQLWCIIDRCFGIVIGIEIIKGERTLVTSAIRKNAKRALADVCNSVRKNMGRRFDSLIRKNHSGSIVSLEYGVAEVAKTY
ncbi:hypothetical protein K501DRAFT_181838 [Backusella circina FSU 941]|nr:hypothetical protein K501DRAFT_181838 [Backusella circina FSU 941]